MRRLCALLVFMWALCLLCACGQKTPAEEPSPRTNPPAVESITVTVGGEPASPSSAPSPTPAPTEAPTPAPTAVPLPYEGLWVLSMDGVSLTLNLTGDYAFALTYGDTACSGTFSEEDGTLHFSFEGGSFVCGFSQDGDDLTLVQEGFEDLHFIREVQP